VNNARNNILINPPRKNDCRPFYHERDFLPGANQFFEMISI
jgi:hypothetical protein